MWCIDPTGKESTTVENRVGKPVEVISTYILYGQKIFAIYILASFLFVVYISQ